MSSIPICFTLAHKVSNARRPNPCNDWKVRVPEAEKVEAAKQMEAVFGPAITGRELYRFVRDDAYALLSNNQLLPHDADLNSWFSIANAISMPTDQVSADTIRFHEMKRIATSHMTNLIEKTRNTEAFQNYDKTEHPYLRHYSQKR